MNDRAGNTRGAKDFAAWLSDALGTRPNTYLVQRSGTKPNGRPRIDASRVHSWLKGERPSFNLATIAAEALGRPADEALRAAGYDVPAAPAPIDHNPGPRVDVLDAIKADPDLLPEAKAHLINQYGLLLRVQAAAAAEPEEDKQRHLRAARRVGERPVDPPR